MLTKQERIDLAIQVIKIITENNTDIDSKITAAEETLQEIKKQYCYSN